MRKTAKQKKRIMENIFDIINNTGFKAIAEKEMEEDLQDKNISFNYKGIITIKDKKSEIYIKFTEVVNEIKKDYIELKKIEQKLKEDYKL